MVLWILTRFTCYIHLHPILQYLLEDGDATNRKDHLGFRLASDRAMSANEFQAPPFSAAEEAELWRLFEANVNVPLGSVRARKGTTTGTPGGRFPGGREGEWREGDIQCESVLTTFLKQR